MSYYDDENDDPGFFRRYRIVIGAIVFVVISTVVSGVIWIATSIKPKPHKPQEIMVKLLPPPPLPPPPPPPPPPKTTPPPREQKMVEQPKVKPDEAKPKEAKNDRPPSNPGPKASGPPSDEGIGGNGGGGEIGGDDDGGSKYGWYANEVSRCVQDALSRNSKTKTASLHVKVRIWANASGRITRAELSGSSGDPAIDQVIKNEVLTGLQLQEPPPGDMPMPIVMMIKEQRPG